ncbi:cell division protein FtsZ, partial [Chloroflexota bacterium]
KLADDVVRRGVQAISEVITVPGLINLDFADVKAIMKEAGPAWMSVGTGSGPNRAKEAANNALASPLLDVSVQGSKGVLFNIVGDSSLSLFEVNEASEVIKRSIDPEANIIFGVAHDERMAKEVRITLIATGFASREGLTSDNEDEITRLFTSLKENEEELDVPTFLRRPFFNQRQRMIPPLVKADKQPLEIYSH